MDKLTMAHDWAMQAMSDKQKVFLDAEGLAWKAWAYADAMQAEADKRKENGFPESLKSHEHNWENVTTMGDNVAKFVCADCGAVKHDVVDKSL